jgi:hypothetical protein
MLLNEIERIWYQGKVLKAAFEEYKLCIEAVYDQAGQILTSPVGTPLAFDVSLDEIPPEFYSLRRNLFSTLFQSIYQLLGINPQRRLLYGRLNHLFRTWVTSADNLLDGEDKIVVPIKIAGSSRVMRQVISIMLADRILAAILDDAVSKNLITVQQAKLITEKSLQILLPSAAEEASEEGGILTRPEPDYVLSVIHTLKTGILFHIPFLGPDNIEQEIDGGTLNACKQGLMNFGIGCQILDDIRDVAKDYLEMRHNYVLSKMSAERPDYLEKLHSIKKTLDPSASVFTLFPDVVCPAAEKATELLTDGLITLDTVGLGIGRPAAMQMTAAIFLVLGVGDLTECLKTRS